MFKLLTVISSIAILALSLIGSMLVIVKVDVWASADYLLVCFTALLLAVIFRAMDLQGETDAGKLTK